ncbi:NAM domain-containing protein [Cephalotus follicularis]|uniref:NAM domain-containing protein n=1 Tax=Cephalotus follicularis TaxID=3775 RepID=A0A1Q3D8K8_CEPFO|nr:NAM domain-containing protein [Cephalotus follicularis]
MEKSSFPLNGECKLPIGFRFHPTDEELVVHYLKRKVSGIPLPASVIPDFDVFQTDPWSLPGYLKEKRYFFSKRKGNENGNKCKRIAGSGYWKPIGNNKQIIASVSKQVLGMRKTLVFYQGKCSHHDTHTQWIMHQYCLVGFLTLPKSNQIVKMECGDWIVYRVFQRKRKPKKGQVVNSWSNKNQIVKLIVPICTDFTIEESSDIGPPQPSSPSSNGITEVSFDGLDHEETSAYIGSSLYSCMRKN